MRVESVIAITSQQPNSEQVLPISKTQHGTSTSGLIFQEYLKANLQNLQTPVVPRQTESQIAGLLLGNLRQMRVSRKDNTEFETSII